MLGCTAALPGHGGCPGQHNTKVSELSFHNLAAFLWLLVMIAGRNVYLSQCGCQVNIAQTKSHDSINFGFSRNGTGRIHGPFASRGFLVPFGAGSKILSFDDEAK